MWGGGGVLTVVAGRCSTRLYSHWWRCVVTDGAGGALWLPVRVANGILDAGAASLAAELRHVPGLTSLDVSGE